MFHRETVVEIQPTQHSVVDISATISAVAVAGLTLTNGADSLSIEDAGASTTSTRVIREIKILGHPIITAAQARSYAVLLHVF